MQSVWTDWQKQQLEQKQKLEQHQKAAIPWSSIREGGSTRDGARRDGVNDDCRLAPAQTHHVLERARDAGLL